MKPYVILAGGCVHPPFEDRAAVDVFCQVGEVVKPDKLVWLGDAADCWHWSRHNKSWLSWPKQRLAMDPESEIEYVRDFHSDVLRRVQPRTAAWVSGNHENRVRLWYERNAPGVVTSRDDFASKFGVADLGFRFYPVDMKFRNVGFFHGWYARQTRTNAKANYLRYGMDCFGAHVHRDEEYVQRHSGSGLHGCFLSGCLCHVNPDWTVKPDWHQSFFVITFFDKMYHVERVRVIDGVGIYGGRRFVGKDQ